MSRYVFKLPDLGEGTVEAEIVGWRVKPGDVVAEDDVVVEVMTEKAAVEVPAPVSGRVVSTTGAPGDMVPVGTELIVLETDAAGAAATAPATPAVAPAAAAAAAPAAVAPAGSAVAAARVGGGGGNGGTAPDAAPTAVSSARVATSPAIRRRAYEAGVDLRQVAGTGPSGRIVPKDLEAYVARRAQPTPLLRAPKAVPASRPAAPAASTEEIKVIGLRRLIAQRMSEAKRTIPHFAYVEELDITELESLRRHLNGRLPAGSAPLTYLPLLALALIRVLREFPQCNAHYDAERGVIVRYSAVHLGIATQTPEGLKVRHRQHAHHQRAGSRHHRRQPCRRAAAGHRRRHRDPSHHEPLLLLRSPLRRWVRRGIHDPGAEGVPRAPGDDLHTRLRAGSACSTRPKTRSCARASLKRG